MKKFYTALCAMAITTMAFAQTEEQMYTQIPNGGFEGEWASLTPWNSDNSAEAQGTTPTPWCISNVYAGSGFLAMGNATLGEKVEGYNSTSAVKLIGKSLMGQSIPGYITLGTTWSTSTDIVPKNKDGGTFGGQYSEIRPDALTFMYKRAAGKNNEGSSVVAYLWKGTWEQANVPGKIVTSGTPPKINMVNRDRNILGMSTDQGGEVTKSDDAELIAVINTAITDAKTEWTAYSVDFTYKSEATPKMMNVIFAAADYFSAKPQVDNELTIDDVKYIFYSRLSTITVNGTAIDDFNPDKYEYEIEGELPASDAIAYTCLGNSGTSSVIVNRNETENSLSLVCTNAQGEDKDGLKEHTYTLTFKTAEEPEQPGERVTYTGTLNIDMRVAMSSDDAVMDMPNQKLYLTPTGEGKCTLSILGLKLGEGDEAMDLGDIVVPNIAVTENNGVKEYNGTGIVKLLGDFIVADAEIYGTEDVNGNISLKIDVKWESETTNIKVTFNGKKDPLASIGSIDADENAPAEYYDLRGIRHNADSLAPGIYIKRQGTKTTKVVVR